VEVEDKGCAMALVSALGRLLNALTQDVIPHIWAQAQRLLAMDLAFFSEFGYVYTSLSTQCRDRRSNYKLEMLLWLKVWEGNILLNADAMVCIQVFFAVHSRARRLLCILHCGNPNSCLDCIRYSHYCVDGIISFYQNNHSLYLRII
jgi:hypothetical protein